MKLTERLRELSDIPYKISEVMYKEMLDKKLARIPLDYQSTEKANRTAETMLEAMVNDGKLHAYIFGNVGTGKTYMAFEILKIIWRRQLPGRFVLFQKDINQFSRHDEFAAYSNKLSSYRGLLIIDEMFYDSSYEKLGVHVYNILNNRFIDQYPTIITTNHDTDDITAQIADPRISRRINHYCYKARKTKRYSGNKK